MLQFGCKQYVFSWYAPKPLSPFAITATTRGPGGPVAPIAP